MPSYCANNPTLEISHEPSDPHLRYARPADVESIYDLLKPYADKGIILYKDPKKIEADLGTTIVYDLAAPGSGNSTLLGVANLYRYDDSLYEVRGLAVLPEHQKKHIGRKIIYKLLFDLKKKSPERSITVFALTIVPEFFKKLGWQHVPKDKFPRKVFEDCTYCIKKNECFEDAVETQL